MLEALGAQGGEDAVGHLVGGNLGTPVEGFLAARVIPDLRVHRAGLDQLHRDRCAVQVHGHRLAPATQREFACTVGAFVDYPEPAADTGHVDDRARSPLAHPRQQGQRQPHRGEEVDPHDLFDLVGIQRGDRAPLRDGRVVDQHVDAPERVPGGRRQVTQRGGVGQVGDPHRRSRGGTPAVGQDLGQPIPAARDQPDHCATAGQTPGQGRAQTRRSARDQHPLVRHQ